MIKRNSFGVTPEKASATKAFNNNQVKYVQGFRQIIAGSTTTTMTLTLTASGRALLGISVVPFGTTDLSDTQITFLVNNNNLLNAISIQNVNPNYVQGGMFYFPIPQPLFGNDTIQANIIKNDISGGTITLNVFYLPNLGHNQSI